MAKYPISEEAKYTGEEASYQASRKLLFKQNRSFELHIGQAVYFFEPNGSVEVPASVLEHSDFESQKDFFVIL